MMHVIFWMLRTRLQQEKTLYLQRWFPVASDSSSYRVLFYLVLVYKNTSFSAITIMPHYIITENKHKLSYHKNISTRTKQKLSMLPQTVRKSSRDWNTSTPIQGQKRIRDSHWGMFDFSDSLPHLFPDKLHIPVTASGCVDMALTAVHGRRHT